eukprot:COSAG01_NODE_2347_length_7858_cov_6.577007_7_plen_571_part_00
MNVRALIITLMAAVASSAAHAAAGGCTCCAAGPGCVPVLQGPAPSSSECASLYAACSACAGGNGVCHSSRLLVIMPPGLTIPVGIVGMLLGAVVCTAGYRLRKYTVFILGFLIFGAIAAFTAFGFLSSDCAASQAASIAPPPVGSGEIELWTDECTTMYVAMAGSGVGFGIIGGFCLFKSYLVVLYCMGCAVGMGGFILLASVVLVYTTSDFNGVVNLVSMITSDPPTYAYVILGLNLVIGIIVGLLFIRFGHVEEAEPADNPKTCVMIGTACLGSYMFFAGIFQGWFLERWSLDRGSSDDRAALVLAEAMLTILGAVAGFFIQRRCTAADTSEPEEIEPLLGGPVWAQQQQAAAAVWAQRQQAAAVWAQQQQQQLQQQRGSQWWPGRDEQPKQPKCHQRQLLALAAVPTVLGIMAAAGVLLHMHISDAKDGHFGCPPGWTGQDCNIKLLNSTGCPDGSAPAPEGKYCVPLDGDCRGPNAAPINSKFNIWPEADGQNKNQSDCASACNAEPNCVGYSWAPETHLCQVYGAGIAQHASPPWIGDPHDDVTTIATVQWGENHPVCVAIAGKN